MMGSAILLYLAIRSGRIISRVEGAVFLGLYATYIGLMFVA